MPYRGAAPAAQALAAGHVHMMFDVVSLALGPIQAGTVRAIGVASKERVSVLPDVPTLGEQGFPGEIGAWFGLLAPAGTPPRSSVAQPRSQPRVHDARHAQAIRRPGRRHAARHAGGFRDISPTTPRFGEVIRRAGIKVE